MTVTVRALLTDLSKNLSHHAIPNAPREARLIVAHAMGVDPGQITLLERDEIARDVADAARSMVTRRVTPVPLSHILGYREFWGRRFAVGPDVLDPRPETETLIAAALERQFQTLLDLGTGSGAIALTLLAERPAARGVATDISRAALDMARQNAVTHGVADRLILQVSDWFSQVHGTFDLIVSNPPYIHPDDMAQLTPEVRAEPHSALTDGVDGLDPYRIICATAQEYLTPGGQLLMEFGAGQWPDVRDIALREGWRNLAVLADLDGRERVLSAETPA